MPLDHVIDIVKKSLYENVIKNYDTLNPPVYAYTSKEDVCVIFRDKLNNTLYESFNFSYTNKHTFTEWVLNNNGVDSFYFCFKGTEIYFLYASCLGYKDLLQVKRNFDRLMI